MLCVANGWPFKSHQEVVPQYSSLGTLGCRINRFTADHFDLWFVEFLWLNNFFLDPTNSIWAGKKNNRGVAELFDMAWWMVGTSGPGSKGFRFAGDTFEQLEPRRRAQMSRKSQANSVQVLHSFCLKRLWYQRYAQKRWIPKHDCYILYSGHNSALSYVMSLQHIQRTDRI